MWGFSHLMDTAVSAFKNVEKSVKAGENLVTPYAWENYDIVLVPEFQFGAMENPHLTVFATEHLDSNYFAYIDVHEIAHQWFGNLMTYKNFEHFWLNEGLTVFLSSNIIAEVHGAAEQGLHEAWQWDKLKREMRKVDDKGKPFKWKALVNNLTGELHLFLPQFL